MLPYSELESHKSSLSCHGHNAKSRRNAGEAMASQSEGPSLFLLRQKKSYSLPHRASAYASLFQPLQCFLRSDGVSFPYCFTSPFCPCRGIRDLVVVGFFLQSLASSYTQNKFSSKIAIKSLWKFISIVAAIASLLLLSCSRRRASSLCWSSALWEEAGDCGGAWEGCGAAGGWAGFWV